VDLMAVFLTGLLAGGVSCAAVQGGLLAGLVSRQKALVTVPARAQQELRWQAQLGEDLAPVAGFIGGKLLSHALFGALLGAVGSAVELSSGLRAIVQVAAGFVILGFALAQLKVPGFQNFTFTPPESWVRFVRGTARGTHAIAPAFLGFASILIPCGVTLSVMALAVTAGSPARGAAMMAVFVIGTAPLFTAIGYAASKAAEVWKGRLATATGVVLLLAGVYTLNGGLTLMGSPFAAQNVAQAVGAKPSMPQAADASVVSVKNGQQTAVVTVTPGQYSPGNIAVKAGVPTTLVFRADGAAGCVRAVVIPSLDRQWILPEDGDTKVALGALKPGRIDFTCGMGMYRGAITVKG
jgi:sulfite exporter TauE/SafE